jgi:hypothetical protein
MKQNMLKDFRLNMKAKYFFPSLYIHSLNYISIISSVLAKEIYVYHGHVFIFTYLSKSPLVRTKISVFLKLSKKLSINQINKTHTNTKECVYDKGRFWPNLRNCLYRYNIKHNH